MSSFFNRKCTAQHILASTNSFITVAISDPSPFLLFTAESH